MGKKKPVVEAQPRRTSTRPIKKKKMNSDQQEFFEESSQLSQSEKDNSDEGYSDSDNDNDESQSSSSEIPAQKLAVRNMEFRERRGTKMNYLINRKKEEEEDPFWAQQGQNYFGNLDDGDNDQEDYLQSSSGRDEFDSDFGQTESEHQQEEGGQEKEVDEQEEKNKKKKQELMRKIHAPAPKKPQAKTAVHSSSKKGEVSDLDKKATQPSTRYIHEMFSQEQLLGEAATTEYFNWLSLKKLISLQTEKKDFTIRSHHVEGPKVIYRNRFDGQGKRLETFELEDVQVQGVEDLTKIMNS